jgi:anti-sigma-K factor RskA
MNDQGFSGLTNDDIMESLPAFVVGALDPDEMLVVDEYLHDHPELVERVHELELAAARLAYAAPPQPLPKETYDKIMGRARASLPPMPQAPATRAPNAPPRPLPQPVQPATSGGWWRKQGPWAIGLGLAVAALLAVAILYRGSLGEIEQLRTQVQGLQNQVATIQQQNTELQNTNTRLQGELDMRQNQIASIANATQAVALAGTDADPKANGTLYVSGDTGTLVLTNLDKLGEDKVYQLWLIPVQGAPIPAGLVGRAEQPVVTLTLPLPASMDNIAAVGVSVEPPSGSEQPTGPIVLLGHKA